MSFASWPQTLGVLKLITFAIGKKRNLSSGIEHVRSAVPVAPDIPARNQTGPCCPTVQFDPVVSSSGLTLVGIDTAHCHHSAVKAERLSGREWSLKSASA